MHPVYRSFLTHSAHRFIACLIILAPVSPVQAAKCFLQVSLSELELTESAASTKIEGLTPGQRVNIDSAADSYYVLVEGHTLESVTYVGEKAGEQKTADAGAPMMLESMEETVFAAAVATPSEEPEKTSEWVQFIPYGPLVLYYFCRDGSDEGPVWEARTGLLMAKEQINALLIWIGQQGATR